MYVYICMTFHFLPFFFCFVIVSYCMYVHTFVCATHQLPCRVFELLNSVALLLFVIYYYYFHSRYVCLGCGRCRCCCSGRPPRRTLFSFSHVLYYMIYNVHFPRGGERFINWLGGWIENSSSSSYNAISCEHSARVRHFFWWRWWKKNVTDIITSSIAYLLVMTTQSAGPSVWTTAWYLS